MPVARRCFVSGRVQGVFYRASTRDRALELGLSGHAINLPDGRVEVLVVGEPDAVTALIDWLAIGPPAAHVHSVDIEDVPAESAGHAPGRFLTA
ncbi:MAG TPA: acylphosphatase [Steroidobacteraceae bacterium]|nr:acylphosphatase [Steroidobacteraceae bacterium]